MVIKNNGNNSINFQSNAKQDVDAVLAENISIKMTSSDGDMEFNKPGEFEFKGIDIVAREVRQEAYNANINACKVTVDGVKTLILYKAIEFKQEDKSALSGVDILVLSEETLAELDTLVTELEPQKVVVVQNSSTEEELSEKIKKSASGDIVSDKTLKFKQEDFLDDLELVKLEVYILKK